VSAPCHDGKNIAPVLLPLRRKEVEATPRDGVIGRRLLGGFRGRVRGDIPAAANAIMAVAAFAQANQDRLVELDVNPLLVLPEGQGAIAVDALIRLVGDPADGSSDTDRFDESLPPNCHTSRHVS
jgi:acetate---CoA ligase (ADP-forming)